LADRLSIRFGLEGGPRGPISGGGGGIGRRKRLPHHELRNEPNLSDRLLIRLGLGVGLRRPISGGLACRRARAGGALGVLTIGVDLFGG